MRNVSLPRNSRIRRWCDQVLDVQGNGGDFLPFMGEGRVGLPWSRCDPYSIPECTRKTVNTKYKMCSCCGVEVSMQVWSKNTKKLYLCVFICSTMLEESSIRFIEVVAYLWNKLNPTCDYKHFPLFSRLPSVAAQLTSLLRNPFSFQAMAGLVMQFDN